MGIKDDIQGLHTKVDKIDDRLDQIQITQVRQADSLDNHIERTHLLEQIVKPMHKTYIQCLGVIKFLGIVATIGGCVWIINLFV